MKRKIAISLILLVAAGGGAYWYWTNQEKNPDGALVLYGNVDIRLVDVSFRVEGRLHEMLAEEGDKVTKGQVLARVDDVYLRDQVALAKARAAAQQAAVDKLNAGTRPEEIAQARALVEERDAAVANAKSTYRRQADLARRDVASRQKLEDAEAEMRKSDAQLKQAKDALALAVAGPRKEDIQAALAQLREDQAIVSLAERRLADAELRAPSNGIIQTRVREPGAMVAPGTTVYTLALTSPVWVRAYVGETNLDRAVPGAKVEIHTDSDPGKVYHGQIGFVSPVAEFTPKTVETPRLRTSLVYRLRIVVDNPDDKLRQGMPVTVTLPKGA